MTKKSFACMQLILRNLKKFIYLSGKVLMLFETLNFQKKLTAKDIPH